MKSASFNKISSLKNKLDSHYKYFDRTQISPDPIEFPHKFTNPLDIEISAFIASVFAYGNVKQINKTLERLHTIMDWQPYNFVMNYSARNQSKLFSNVKHRFYTSSDIQNFFYGLNKVYKTHGSLKNLFLKESEEEFELKTSVSNFSSRMIELCKGKVNPTRGIVFMFPDPQKGSPRSDGRVARLAEPKARQGAGSACKRMNLFLRWMVRRDELDFGLWNEIPTSKLLIPVDVHVARICKRLKLTTRKNVSWKMAEEITNQLKKFDPDDPVKYDFAICHIGMRKLTF